MLKAVVRLRRIAYAAAAVVMLGISAVPAQAAVVGAKPVSSYQANGRVDAIQQLTADPAKLQQLLKQPPEVAYGTRIYDALDRGPEGDPGA